MGGFQVNSAFWWQFNNKTIDCIVKKYYILYIFNLNFTRFNLLTVQDTQVLSPAPCPDHLQLVVVVTSRVDNRVARDAIRQVGELSFSYNLPDLHFPPVLGTGG